jgi:phosphopantothenate synthetase
LAAVAVVEAGAEVEAEIEVNLFVHSEMTQGTLKVQ